MFTRGRIVKGSGYPIRFPFIDVAEFGAEGGTIAWIDEGSALRVGTRNVGAHPGPACYGMRGKDPTITDANLLLGGLPPYLLSWEIMLHQRMAKEAIRDRIADPLGLELHEDAYGIVRIATP